MNKQKCSVDSCELPRSAKGWCNRHYLKWLRVGDPNAGRQNRVRGAGSITPKGYIDRTEKGIRRLEHVRIAECALGRRLPNGAVVHHANGDATDNSKANLVICPNNGYHKHLHRRLNAYKATGNPNLLKCHVCHQFDYKENLVILQLGGYKMDVQHRSCRRIAEKRRRQNRKQRFTNRPSIS